jgi:Sigma-70, region 4
MPAKRSAMRKVKEVLRLKFEAELSHEEIAAATGMSKGAVTNTVQRAMQKGLGGPLPAQVDVAALEALLYRKAAPPDRFAQPNYAVIHQELKRKGVPCSFSARTTRRLMGRARTSADSSA